VQEFPSSLYQSALDPFGRIICCPISNNSRFFVDYFILFDKFTAEGGKKFGSNCQSPCHHIVTFVQIERKT